jgi:FkbM family methyltransferase
LTPRFNSGWKLIVMQQSGRFRHQLILTLKRIYYAGRGEPFSIQGHTLRYVPGTRPTRLKYFDSQHDWVARYDALALRLISETLSEGDTAIDIGAHCGEYAVIMAALCGPTGCVVAFEPDPRARQRLMRNLSLKPHITSPRVESLAVSATKGETILYSRHGGANSSLAPIFLAASEIDTEKISVRTVTLDDYLYEQRLPSPRWVKIDTEGAEIGILKGAERLLASCSGIICELHPYAWPKFGNTLEELKNLVSASGRRIRYLDQENEIGDEATYGAVVLER